jgi:hypothetical protein
MSSALLQLELEIKDRLEEMPFFAPFTVLVEPRKNIVSEIQSRIGKLKTLIAPKVVGADDDHPNISGVYFDAIRISVGIFQNPILKGDHADPFEIAEEIHKALKNWTPVSLANAINPAKPGIEPIADDTLNIVSCNFAARGGFVGAVPAVTTPVITITGTPGTVLTCATVGAAMFYTLDNSNPSPRAGTYAAPGTDLGVLAPGSTLKVRAFLAGYLHSSLAKLQT